MGLQRGMNCMKCFCEEFSLKMDACRTNTAVFKKVIKLIREEKWWLGGEEIGVVKEIKYLGIVFDNRGK